MNIQPRIMTGRAHSHEMQQKSRLHDPFFGLKTLEQRPQSVMTEIVDTDWEEDEDIVSEIEDDDPNSPRISLNSSGQRSATTLSSYEEAQTPRSSRTREAFFNNVDPAKPVEGPRGPHLFRSSAASSSISVEFQDVLTLSPITPKTARQSDAEFRFAFAQEPLPLPRRKSSPFRYTHQELDKSQLVYWTQEQVAQWMLNAGIELSVADKFVDHDVSGEVLITMKFEDMRELGITSFGVRTKVWAEIQSLRDSRPGSPRPETPIEDEPCKEVKIEARRFEEECGAPKRGHSKRRQKPRRQASGEDIITPMESVSIVGIEQIMPKPHHCSKGENCSKHRRYMRLLEAFKKEHPNFHIDPFVDEDGGIIMVAGDPGNPSTAHALNKAPSTEVLRPVSDAVPSVVASSDVLGPGGYTPLQYLQEAALRNLQTQDPQDNVRQFLNFQHQHVTAESSEVPPTPPFEIRPGTTQSPHEGLRALPKLAIPAQQAQRASQHKPSALQNEFVPYQMDKADPLSPDLATPIAPYRFGTPFSEMDVPVTAIPLGPVARDTSQSVPPDMNYRTPIQSIKRSLSRASKRPSIQIMPPVHEHYVATAIHTAPLTKPPTPPPSRTSPKLSPQPRAGDQPLRAPPRGQYPWSPAERSHSFEKALPLIGAAAFTREVQVQDAEGITYAGLVKKRKTKMLRHEWNDYYCTLKGTRLAVHKDADDRNRTLEYVDIDDYAIACSGMASSSKLNAAFKAMNISRGKDRREDHIAAFAFQLIPQGKEGMRLRKRESSFSGGSKSAVPAGAEGDNGTGKTHHFAVKNRDERIDWMREMMLAKALKQKGEGFEVSVNGNMI